ncbi:MAG: hypothetical protein GX946_05245 [Oligosphaeraceae bacterium]|nr:hypothetical protein [Oligosphaeraceae bacterium]
MNGLIEVLLLGFLLCSFMLAGSSRLMHCIKLVATQGLLLGILPLAVAKVDGGSLGGEALFVAFINVAVKGAALPYMLQKAMQKADVRRELEPLLGYAASGLVALILIAVSFWFAQQLNYSEQVVSRLAAPVAFSGILIGLFLIVARRKALTQVIGFLCFENSIALFGAGMMLHYGALIELGILLDVFVMVFVMGIAVFQIKQEFQHINADLLNTLKDKPRK